MLYKNSDAFIKVLPLFFSPQAVHTAHDYRKENWFLVKRDDVLHVIYSSALLTRQDTVIKGSHENYQQDTSAMSSSIEQ